MRRNDKEQGAEPASTASAMITPLDIQQKEFQVSRFGGYRMRDVDEFLDELTDAMSAVLAENERLRAGASSSPIVGSPDLDEVSRQADEIIQRARDEAARIVADANERSASIAGRLASGSVTEADRAAIDAFLGRERAFLQSLAALVQEHADGVKGMARDVRRRNTTGASDENASAPAAAAASTPAASTASAVSAEEEAASSAPRPDVPPPSSAGRSDAPASTEPEATTPITPVPGAADEPIVVSEPEPAGSRRDEEPRDESLRELFWGEEN